MLKISDFYGYWIIQNRSSIYIESTFIIIDENLLSIFLGPLNYIRTNNFYDLKYTYLGINPEFSVNYKSICS